MNLKIPTETHVCRYNVFYIIMATCYVDVLNHSSS